MCGNVNLEGKILALPLTFARRQEVEEKKEEKEGRGKERRRGRREREVKKDLNGVTHKAYPPKGACPQSVT